MSQAGHANAYDIGLERAQTLVIHPPTAHHTRREIIDHEITLLCQPPRDVDAARIRHIDRDRKLVAMQVALQAGLTRAGWSRLALELDHFRAVIREDSRCYRSRDNP